MKIPVLSAFKAPFTKKISVMKLGIIMDVSKDFTGLRRLNIAEKLPFYYKHVLRGAEKVLEGMKCVITEVNMKELYAGCAQIEDFDAFLGERGFMRVCTDMTRHGWGDALYLRKLVTVQFSLEIKTYYRRAWLTFECLKSTSI